MLLVRRGLSFFNLLPVSTLTALAVDRLPIKVLFGFNWGWVTLERSKGDTIPARVPRDEIVEGSVQARTPKASVKAKGVCVEERARRAL